MKNIFFPFLLLLISCSVTKKNLQTKTVQTSFQSLLEDNTFANAKMDSLIKNDDIHAHHLCEYSPIPNNNVADTKYNPSCELVPFKTFKFNWPDSMPQNLHNFSDYLVPDSNFLFYYTHSKDSILGFTNAYRDRNTNKWKMKGGSQNDGNPESGGTFQNVVFNECKSKSTEVFIIRYSERKKAFAFFNNNELNVITYYFPDIIHHKNFNDWASKLSRAAYQ